MEIKNGILEGGSCVQEFDASPNVGRVLHPEMIILHFTGGHRTQAAINWLKNPKSKASAHFVVDQDGFVTQLVSCDLVAWHAGKSAWGKRTSVNSFAIGIEMVNSGLVKQQPDGSFQNASGDPVSPHRVMRDIKGRFWECFTSAQVSTTLLLVKALMAAYPGISEIAGHEDVAPKRKIDPGPAFPWDELNGIENLSVRGRVPVKPQSHGSMAKVASAVSASLRYIRRLLRKK